MPDKSSGAGSEGTEPQSPQPPKKSTGNKKKVSYKGRSGTPPEVQAQIIGALLSGQFSEDQDVAKAIGVSKSTVSRLRKQIPPEYVRQIETEKKDRIGELVGEFLEEALESLKRIDAITHDQDWLKAQDAPGLATFYGVKADKVIKILQAIEEANRAADDDETDLTEGAQS